MNRINQSNESNQSIQSIHNQSRQAAGVSHGAERLPPSLETAAASWLTTSKQVEEGGGGGGGGAALFSAAAAPKAVQRATGPSYVCCITSLCVCVLHVPDLVAAV